MDVIHSSRRGKDMPRALGRRGGAGRAVAGRGSHRPAIEPLESRLMLSINYVFPTDGGIIYAEAYGAIPNDGIDDTAAIQAAINANAGGRKIIYLRDGVYDISGTIKWAGEYKRTTLQGQSSSGTILRLQNNCSGFQDPANRMAVIWTGSGVAQRFGNSVRALTVDVGSGNPGAVGIQYMSNNWGTLNDVIIRSASGQGHTGLDLAYSNEIGPCLIKDVTVIGFDYGIKTANAVDSQTFENITLQNQNLYGFYVGGQCVSIHNLISTNSVTALYAADFVTLVNATLTGTGAASGKPAIINNSKLFARDVVTSGYQMAIQNNSGTAPNAAGPNVLEFSSHGVASLFDTPQQSLRLEILQTPDVPWDPISSWVKVNGAAADDTAAIQAAIDATISDPTKTTVYFPNGTYTISGDIYIRGHVRRIIGLEAALVGSGTIRLVDSGVPGGPDVVVWEHISQSYSQVAWSHDSSRTWVLRNANIGPYSNTGTGDLFIEDVCGAPWTFTNQRVWARQINPENFGVKILNDGGQLWILGLKTERGGTLIETINGGKTEVLGGFAYSTSSPKTTPMFINKESSVSISIGESCYNGNPFYDLVWETRGGEIRQLHKGQVPGRQNGSAIVLYVGYELPDASGPAIELVHADTRNSKQVTVVFMEPVNRTLAETVANWSISNGVAITSASLASDNVTVTLTTAGSLSKGVNYTLTVSNVTDLAGNAVPAGYQKPFVYEQAGDGLLGEYYDNADFTTPKGTRVDPTINFVWSGSPGFSMGSDSFSVRWTGYIEPLFTGKYSFYSSIDDGLKLWIDGQLVEQEWTNGSNDLNPDFGLELQAGVKYPITIEFYENTGTAKAQLYWYVPGQVRQIVPQHRLFSSAVNEHPAVYAGPDQTVLVTDVVDLLGLVTDDGLPSGSVSSTWSKVSGPGSVTFGYPSQPATTALFSTPGVYVLRLTAGDGALSSYEEVTITVNAVVDTTPPEIDSACAPVGGQVKVVFSEAVSEATATAVGNYALSGGLSVLGAALGGDFRTVTLTTSAMTPATAYTLTVNNVQDLLGNAIAPDSQESFIYWGVGDGLAGSYYDNSDFTGFVLVRTDATVDFNWGSGSPDPAIGADTYSVRWEGFVNPEFSETYTFYTRTDDGVRLWVNGVLLVDRWVNQSATEYSGAISLSAGVLYTIRMDYYENTGSAVAQLSWSSPSRPKQIIPQARLFSQLPAVNAAPTADAGEDAATSAASIALSGTVGDDGLPNPPGALTIGWSKVSGPGDVAFADPAAAATTVTFSQPGTYVLRLTAHDGQLQASDEVTISVSRLEGDLAWDGVVDAADIDAMFAAIRSASSDPLYDLNGDELVNQADADKLIRDILSCEYGDVNLDGAVDEADLQPMGAGWGLAGGWAQGDLNGDGAVNLDDLIRLAMHWGWTRPPEAAPPAQGESQALPAAAPSPAADELLAATAPVESFILATLSAEPADEQAQRLPQEPAALALPTSPTVRPAGPGRAAEPARRHVAAGSQGRLRQRQRLQTVDIMDLSLPGLTLNI